MSDAAPPAGEHQDALHRVLAIPIVHDTLATVDSVIHKSPTVGAIYDKGASLVVSSVVEPLSKGRLVAPVLGTVDKYSNQTLDYAQAKWPYPFETPTQEIIDRVKKPAEDVYSRGSNAVSGTYNAVNERIVSPVLDVVENTVHRFVLKTGATDAPQPTENGGGSPIKRAVGLGVEVKSHFENVSAEQWKKLQSQSVAIQRSTEYINSLNKSLKDMIEARKANAQAVGDRSKASVQNLLEELKKLQNQSLDLPSNLRQQAQPYFDTLSKSYADVTHIILREDGTPQEKTKKVVQYVHETTLPYLHHAQDFVTGVLKKGAASANEAQDKVKDAAHEAGEQAENKGYQIKENGA